MRRWRRPLWPAIAAGVILATFAAIALAAPGTPSLVKDINPGAVGSVPSGLTNVNGTLFFSASDGTNGAELWKSDGTAAGTVMVKDINPGGGDSNPSGLTNVNGTLFFAADDGTHGTELWKSDGTSAGTVLVKDINPGGSSNLVHLTNVNGTVFFSADDGTHGLELWKSDGTAAGTVLVKDINPGAGHSIPHELTNVSGTLFFAADDGTNGTELWKSDGTTAGTVMVDDIWPGAGAGDPTNLTSVNGTLFFSANDGTDNAQLWKSDGTTAGTVMVKDINPLGGSGPSFLTDVNGTLFFSADDGTNGFELWKSDGTSAGTVMVKDINPGVADSAPSDLANFNGTVVFAANDGTNGIQLWKSDGTSAGTVMLKDINPGADSDPSGFTASNGIMYFTAFEGTDGRELWQTDGTSAGTTLVADINPGAGSSFEHDLTDLNGTLLFAADDGTHGDELWTLGGGSPKHPTSTSVSCSPASVAVGQTTTCTATVTDTNGGAPSTPSGMVTFGSDSPGSFSNPGAVCTLSEVSAGTASCSVGYTPNAVGSGTHTITGAYGGSGVHQTSSGTRGLTVGNRTTSTAVSCSPPSLVVGQTTTCTVTVLDTGPGTATTLGGTVTFGSDSEGVFTSPGPSCTLDAGGTCHVDYTPSAVDSGTHRLTGTYAGDAGHTGSSGGANVTVANPPPGKRETRMGLFCSSDPVNVGQPISCDVEVRDTDPGQETTPTGAVAFGTDSAGVFSNPGGSCVLAERFAGSAICTVDYTPSAVGSGTHTITAAYGGDGAHNGSSSSTHFPVQSASSVDVVVTGIEVTQAVQNASCTGCLGTLPSRDAQNRNAPGQATYQGVTMAAQKYTVVRVFAHAFAGSSFLSNRFGGISAVTRSTARLEIFDSAGRRIDVLNPDSTPNSLKPPSCGVCVDLAERADPGTSFNFLVPWQDTSHSFLTFRATVTPPVGPGVPGQCAGCGGNTFTLSRVPFLNTISVPIHPIPLALNGHRTAQSVSQVFGDAQTVLPNQLVLYPYDAPLSVDRRGIFGIPLPGVSGSLTNNEAAAAVAQRASDDHLSNADYPIGVFYSGEGSLANGLTTGTMFLGNGPASVVLDNGRPLTSVTHEIGHGLGLPHADTGSPITTTFPLTGVTVTQYIGPHPDGTPDCGGNSAGQVGEAWPPDNEGRLQSVGLDRRSWDFGKPASDLSTFVEGYDHSGIRTTDLNNGARYYDFMSYCPAGGVFESLDWISARNWSRLVTFRNALHPPPFLPPAADRASRAARDPALRVIALVEPDGSASIFDVAPGQQSAGGPTPGSPYQIEVRNAAGDVLQSVIPTTTSIHMDGSAPGTLLTATLPFAPGTASVALTSGGVVLASRTRSAHSPVATLLSPRRGSRVGASAETLVRWRARDADGDPLVTTIDYSADGGRHWKVVADGLTGGSARVASRLLSRSTRARLRLRVSDGFNVTTVTSGRLRAVGAPPLVQILDARPGGRVLANATLLLAAWAFDDSGRPLAGRSLKWFAGRKLLGRGVRLTAHGLPLGTKAIRLVATDSYGRSSQAVLPLRVLPVPTKYVLWRAPVSISSHASRLRIVLASASSSTFTIAGRRFAVGPKPRAITLRIRPGRSALRFACRLRSPGGVIRATYVVSRGR